MIFQEPPHPNIPPLFMELYRFTVETLGQSHTMANIAVSTAMRDSQIAEEKREGNVVQLPINFKAR